MGFHDFLLRPMLRSRMIPEYFNLFPTNYEKLMLLIPEIYFTEVDLVIKTATRWRV